MHDKKLFSCLLMSVFALCAVFIVFFSHWVFRASVKILSGNFRPLPFQPFNVHLIVSFVHSCREEATTAHIVFLRLSLTRDNNTPTIQTICGECENIAVFSG